MLAGAFFVADGLYRITFYESDLLWKSESVLEAKKMTGNAPDLLYLSDCSNTNSIEGDSCKESVVWYLNRNYPQLKMLSIDKPASHAGVFNSWIKVMDVGTWKPKALVVTMGLRTFNSDWINSPLETPLNESLVMARPFPPLLNRFLLALGVYDATPDSVRQQRRQLDWRDQTLDFPYKTKYNSVKTWDSIMGNGSYLLPDGSWDIKKIRLACHYVKAYAFTIKEDNPRLNDFDEIAAWGNKHQVPLVFHIIPENCEYADSLVGKDLIFLMRRNVAFLERRYNKGLIKVLNNLELLKGSCYTEKDWTTEHYSCGGRKILASRLSAQLNEVLK